MCVRTASLLLIAICFAGCGRSKSRSISDNGKPVVVGKLLIQPPPAKSIKIRPLDDAEKFFEDQMAILRGDKLRKSSEMILLRDHADWILSEISLEVSHVRGSSIVNLIGRGGAPEGARALIDEMMESYVTISGSAKTIVQNLKSESAKMEKELLNTERIWNGFKLDNDMVHAETTLTSLQRRQKQLTNAQKFFQLEIDSLSGLSLENDIERRRASLAMPLDMPAEFAVIARITPTLGELAYLSALKQTNPVATEAARKQAVSDRETRLDSYRRQVEIIVDLLAGLQAKIEKVSALQLQFKKIESDYKSAELAYKLAKEAEKNDGLAPYNSDKPAVMASVVERATVTVVGK